MGIDISSIVSPSTRTLSDYAGRAIAIDGYNSLYQFLATIRQPDGTPLKDAEGRITSHLSGLFYRTCSLVEVGIKPVYVFDGIPPTEKAGTIEERRAIRQKAWEEWQMAKEAGDLERAKRKAQQSSRLSKDMVSEAKQLLQHMGIPVVQAPEEGEAQASHMACRGDVYCAASQDFDSLLFGTPLLVRNLTLSGRRKMPKKNIYVDVSPEEINLQKTLAQLEISLEQLVDLAILVGTDFNQGIKGIGPKKALKLIKEKGQIEDAIEKTGGDPGDYVRVREIFLEPKVTDDYALSWSAPTKSHVFSFLCGERGFSETRVSSSLQRLEAGISQRSQKSLDSWF
ncbi:MAG: flap endonuclease-1 [Candidatus Thermoplasmatota archaeon]|nr:flap endonuclease-1 [Candidatus Thermoplasmatota archaeon]